MLTLFIVTLVGASLATFAVLPSEMRTLFGPDSTYVSRLLLGSGFSVIVGIILGNWGLSYFGGAIREILSVSAFVMALGIGALATVNENTPSRAVGLSFLGGLGAGGIVQPAVTMLTIISSDELIATVTGIALSLILVGGSIGFAIYNSVRTNKLAYILPVKVGDAVVAAGLPFDQINTFLAAYFSSNTADLAQYSQSIVRAAQNATTESDVVAFRLIYLVSIAFGVAAVIASLFLRDIRKQMVDRVAVNVY